MRKLALITLLFAISCSESNQKETTPTENEIVTEIDMPEFQALLDSANVKGSILIFSDQQFYSNDFNWAREAHIPASTFKIPNSIIALELGIMHDDSTMIPWDGEPRFMKRWEQDLSFRNAFHTSCVPCYQEIARKVGVKRMKEYTDKLNFGSLDFDSSNIDMFWLDGSSKINQFEEIDFLKRFQENQLPISERTEKIMSRMMVIEEKGGSVLRGKTGWSVQNDVNNCWFVGYITNGNSVHYFATNIQPSNDAEISEIVTIRKELTFEALKILKISI